VREHDDQALTALTADALGPALAPGLYALGTPHQITLDGRVLRAQAAAIVSANDRRIGTVIALSDITADVRRDQMRDTLLDQAARDVQQPLQRLADRGRPAQETAFNRELRRHAADLQKLVLELRELNTLSLQQLAERGQRPINLDTLVWSVANEWRQVAQANNLTLHVIITQSGLYVLGNEHRLRWAIGNLVDNAIRYTPPGGDLTLEIRGETPEGKAHLRIRDNGVGIAPDELPHVFVRFYRGNPAAPSGRPLRVPGTGQGLTTARQIIEAHGGQIGILSKLNVGTAVDFTLPLTAPVSLELPLLHTDMEGETVRIYAARSE
jgi:signal transduction histidine kinase